MRKYLVSKCVLIRSNMAAGSRRGKKKRPKNVGQLTRSGRRMLILTPPGSRYGDLHHKEGAGAPRPDTRHATHDTKCNVA